MVEGSNIVVVCHEKILVLKKRWLKVKFTMFKQKQLEDFAPSGREVVWPLLQNL